MKKVVLLLTIVSLSVLLFQVVVAEDHVFEQYLYDVDCANLFIF